MFVDRLRNSITTLCLRTSLFDYHKPLFSTRSSSLHLSHKSLFSLCASHVSSLQSVSCVISFRQSDLNHCSDPLRPSISHHHSYLHHRPSHSKLNLTCSTNPFHNGLLLSFHTVTTQTGSYCQQCYFFVDPSVTSLFSG